MSLSFPFSKLRGRENFDSWKRNVQSYLTIKGCWDVIEKETIEEADKVKNRLALAELTLTIEESNFAHIAEEETAKGAWNALQKAYGDRGITRKVELLTQLVNTKLVNYSNVQEYINDLVMTSIKIRSTGLNLDDELTASFMLAGLPEEYKPLILAVENSNKQLKIDDVKNLLLQDVKFDNFQTQSAMFSKKKIQCYNCQQFGHIAKNCRNNKNKNSLNKRKDIQQNSSTRTKNSNMNTCMQKHNKNNNNSNDVFLVSLLSKNHPYNMNNWYVDSGATCHMTNNDKLLENKRRVEEREIIVANNEKLTVEYKGDIQMKYKKDSIENRITTKNVEYVPGLCTNLLSVSQLAKQGKKIVFEKNSCIIYNGDRVVATASAENGLYKLNCEIEGSRNVAFNVFEESTIWHRRMGHASYSGLKSVVKANDGIKLNKIEESKCTVCIKGKQTRVPNHQEGTRAKELLEIVHSDVLGPLKRKSFSGRRFLVTFIDDYSRKVFVYPIKNKFNVFDCFVQFKTYAENQCGRKVKILRTDNGKEYVNNKFSQYLQKNGIVHQKTVCYGPEQNGVAERMNRTLVEKVRCMLIDSGLSEQFWAEAMLTAAYLLNRVPCRKQSKSPEELWSNRKPNLKYLRVFGCKAFVHIPKQKRSKLDVKSQECIMLGYSEESKAYKLFDPINKKTITSRDVIFIEDERSDTFQQDYSMFYPIVLNDDNSGKDDMKLELPSTSNETSDEDQYESADEPENEIPVDVPELRRSKRIMEKNMPSASFCALEFVSDDPRTLQEAMDSEDKEHWNDAMQAEIESLANNKTWILADLPKGKKAIKCKWVFKRKFGGNEEPTRFKARLVAKGYSQQEGIDYTETFAPVARYTSIRLLLAMAVKMDLHIHQMDAVSAYLNGNLQEEIYMRQPEGYEDGSSKVCKLLKSIYGLKQSGRVWNRTLNAVLTKNNLIRSESDQCIYYRTEGNNILYVAIYVDDILIFSNSLQSITEMKKVLEQNFKMKDLGEISSILGINVAKKNDSIKIDQKDYIKSILEKFGMSDCNPVSTPFDYNQKISSKMSPKTDDERKEMADVPYMQAIGCLLYAAQITRPDICYAVNVLSRFGTNPGKAHWQAVKRVLRYLKGTLDKGLIFRKNEEDLKGYCDADWAGDIDNRRSTSGYVFVYQHGAISWATKLQKTIALSSTEAELMSVVAATQEAIWLKRLVNELTGNKEQNIVLFCDNKGAIQIALNNSYSPRTKHVDIKAKFVHELIEKRELILHYVSTSEMLADIFTKGVMPRKLETIAAKFGLQ